MPDSQSGGGCRCCCSFIFTLGLTALFMWLSLRPSGPKFSLQKFYIPALNQTLNSTANTTLYFELRLANTNKEKGVYYDPVNVTFYDSPNKSHILGTFTIPKFYQGYKKKAKKSGNMTTVGLDPQAVFRAVANGSAIFRVDVVTSVRYKILVWKTKRQYIAVRGFVNVSSQGTDVNPKKGIKLKSNAVRIGRYWGNFGLLFINLSALVLINL